MRSKRHFSWLLIFALCNSHSNLDLNLQSHQRESNPCSSIMSIVLSDFSLIAFKEVGDNLYPIIDPKNFRIKNYMVLSPKPFLIYLLFQTNRCGHSIEMDQLKGMKHKTKSLVESSRSFVSAKMHPWYNGSLLFIHSPLAQNSFSVSTTNDISSLLFELSDQFPYIRIHWESVSWTTRSQPFA